ncbi:MAG: hypothetical protein D6718_09695 [Acidobacteria bacterium]|nr:MAG: hypothetical protein D6718_09695 [Acidobacteriota bacterium]
MTGRATRRCVAAFLLAAAWPAAAQQAAPPPDAGEGNCLTSGCHANLAEGAVVHMPVEDEACDLCHTPRATGHAFDTPDPIGETCLGCHDDPAGGMTGHVHGPVAAGRCTGCHDPHRSDRGKLLRADSPELCWRCHGRVQTWEGRRPVRNVKEEIETAELPHGAVDAGCDTCHPPHASDYGRLVTDAFPDGPYARGAEGSYALCFACHDETMLEEGADTGFRNEQKNLHRVHVAREKSRSCALCHSPHGGAAHLIRSRAPFGQWDLPIDYEPLADGGRCAVACHEQREYHRGGAETAAGGS